MAVIVDFGRGWTRMGVTDKSKAGFRVKGRESFFRGEEGGFDRACRGLHVRRQKKSKTGIATPPFEIWFANA